MECDWGLFWQKLLYGRRYISNCGYTKAFSWSDIESQYEVKVLRFYLKNIQIKLYKIEIYALFLLLIL